MNHHLNPQKLLLLDRDGVINHDSDAYIKSPDEWLPIAGSLEMMAELFQQGIRIIVVTNQSGVGRGYFSETVLHSIHEKMLVMLEALGGKIEAVYFCPHHPDESCVCRKPFTGMLDKIEQDYQISVKGVPLVGDSAKDIQLALNKSCLPVLVRSGKGSETEQQHSSLLRDVPVFNALQDAGRYLLTHHYSNS